MLLLLLRGLLGFLGGREDRERGRTLLRSFELSCSSTALLLYLALCLLLLPLKTGLKLERRLLLRLLLLSELLRLLKSV